MEVKNKQKCNKRKHIHTKPQQIKPHKTKGLAFAA